MRKYPIRFDCRMCGHVWLLKAIDTRTCPSCHASTHWREELHVRPSRNRETGKVTVFRILAGPGGRYYYSDEIRQRDRLIYIELTLDGHSIELPLSIDDQERIWESTFDVWVKSEKVVWYVRRLIKLVNSKLAQRKLPGMADAYIAERKQAQ